MRAPSKRVPRSRPLWSLWSLWLSCGWASACVTDRPSLPGGEQAPPSGRSEPAPRSIRVGNQARGADAQPDYDLEAEDVRESVKSRLPSPLPDASTACKAMFDAAAAAYVRDEGSASPAAKTIAEIRERDLPTCIAETSPAAAVCVALRANHSGGEFPKLLDQCSRAFPKH